MLAGLSVVMSTSTVPAGGLSPRDRLRARHDEQLTLLATYLGFDAKVVRARTTLDALEADQRVALAELALATSVEIAADLTGVAPARVRDAVSGSRLRSMSPRLGGAGDERA